MRRQRSSGRRWSWLLVSAASVLISGWALPGCEQGKGAYSVLPPDGRPPDYLPPGGVAPGITHTRGLLYRFDRERYRLFKPYPGTDPRYVYRDSVLALREIGPVDPRLLRPDLMDATLHRVYNDPRLFGFISATTNADTFVDGEVVAGSAAEFVPLEGIEITDFWEYNHNGEWTDSVSVVGPLVGPDVPPTMSGGDVYRMRHRVLLTNESIRARRI